MSSNKVASSLKSSAPLPKLLDDNVDEQLVKGKPFNRAAAARCPPAPDLLLVFDQTRDSVQMHVQAASSTAASSPSVHVSSSLVRISLPAAASGNDCSRAPLELQFALSARVARTSDYLVSHTPTTPGLGEAVFTLPKSEHEPWGAVEVPIITLFYSFSNFEWFTCLIFKNSIIILYCTFHVYLDFNGILIIRQWLLKCFKRSFLQLEASHIEPRIS